MIGQSLSNINEKCYNTFFKSFHNLNMALVLWLPSSSYCMAQWRNSMGAGADGSPAKRPPRQGDTRSKRLAQSIFLLGQAKQDQVNVPNTPVFVCYSSVWSSQFFFLTGNGSTVVLYVPWSMESNYVRTNNSVTWTSPPLFVMDMDEKQIEDRNKYIVQASVTNSA
jgi:hypothetical protein